MAKKEVSKVKKRGKAKSIKKKASTESKSTEVVYHSTKEIKVERELIENFIALQKVMVGLSSKFDSLTSQISKLLYLFEVSAKTIAKKEADGGSVDAKMIMEKLDNLSQQAGLIGRGLALIHQINTEEGKPTIPIKPTPQVVTPQVAPQVLGPPNRARINPASRAAPASLSFPSTLLLEPAQRNNDLFEKSIAEDEPEKP